MLNRSAGSWFFLGELFTNLPLPADAAIPLQSSFCGTCQACLDVCPTRRLRGGHIASTPASCISYLTIELKGSIPLELRPLIGNRVPTAAMTASLPALGTASHL